MTNPIAWIDVETTGLDAHNDVLLEIACFVTSPTGEKLKPAPGIDVQYNRFNAVVHHDNPQKLRENSREVVQKMHDASGLWDKLPNGIPLDELDWLLAGFLAQFAGEGEIYLGGSSPRLDLNFIEAYLPRTHAYLSYRFVDVSGMAFVFKEHGFINDYFPKKKNHTAWEDANETYEEFMFLMDSVAWQ